MVSAGLSWSDWANMTPRDRQRFINMYNSKQEYDKENGTGKFGLMGALSQLGKLFK